MRKNELISVIVPVYNVENYIDNCLESIIKQSYQNLEIILINDGSTDKSADKCQRYRKKDNRIKYYEKSNSGPSDTRNYGMEKSKGKYITFVDSDDVLAVNCLEYLYQIMQKSKAEISVCAISHFFDEDVPQFKIGNIQRKVSSKEALKSFFYQKEISTSSCGKLYCKELWDNVKFPTGILFEDNAVLYKVLYRCNTIAYGNAEYYGYRHRKGSITTSFFTVKDFDILEIGKNILKFFENKDKEVYKGVVAYQCSNCLRVYLNASSEFESNSEIQYCKSFLNNNWNSVIKDKNIRLKLKIALLMYGINMPKSILEFLHKKVRRWN